MRQTESLSSIEKQNIIDAYQNRDFQRLNELINNCSYCPTNQYILHEWVVKNMKKLKQQPTAIKNKQHWAGGEKNSAIIFDRFNELLENFNAEQTSTIGEWITKNIAALRNNVLTKP